MTSTFLLLLGLVSLSTATVKLQEMFSWNALDWAYPDQQSRLAAISNGELIPENALPVGIERWNNKLFVSVPRWRAGIPATLNYIPLDAPYDPSPKLTPYPSWQANELGNCASGLTTVYRIKADKCDRLWVLDTGTYGYDPNVTNVCPYSLNVYDLKTDRRIRRYVFRPEDIVADTFIANIALDIGSNCDDAFAYFSDELGYGLIAYSWELNKSWRFSHDYFRPDPLRGDFNIGGLNFQWGAEGIFGITASPIGSDGYRQLYFSPLASHTEFAVSTRVLRNESAVTGSYHEFRVVGDRGQNGHTTAHVMSEGGMKLFALIDQNAIGCWNSALPHKPQNIAVVDKDDNGLLFPCDVKIVNEAEVWVLSDRMSQFLESEFGLDYSDINFRIYTAPLNTLIAGTVCEPTTYYTPPATAPAPVTPQKYYDSRLSQIPKQHLSQGFPRHFQLPQFSQLPQPQLPKQQPQFYTVSQNSFPSVIGQPLAPKVTSYINFPALPTVPLKTGKSSSPNSPWWIKDNGHYKVYE
ncbi:major royal jelly protein domain-containing protein [Phthorimaea operculella]|nr:major royal jelly protein domain-containing protein [Phthorimaea operculella]